MNWSPATAKSLSLLTLLGRSVQQAVLPNACVFCGLQCRLDQPPICEECLADLPWIRSACERCANPLAAELPSGVHCSVCQLDPPPFESAAAPLRYTFPVDAAIKAMKFRRKLFYVPAFAHLLAVTMRELPEDIDALLPVPLHWRRHATRGFNQAAELSKPLQKMTGMPVINNVIRRRATPYQSGLSANHRLRNLRSAFIVRGAIRARHVLIVDDVVTTTQTCRQLAKVLLDAGVEKVSVLAIARA